MNLKEIHQVYFVGIGGIGMSAIARYFASNKKQVAGYDKTPSQITSDLEKLGVEVYFEDDLKKIPLPFLKKEETLIVYTPAIPSNNKVLTYFNEHNFPCVPATARQKVVSVIFPKTSDLFKTVKLQFKFNSRSG